MIKSDIISIHVHVTDETLGMINKDCFLKMKSNVLIVNTARGDIIVESDLIDFLVKNKYAKYATDVLANEVISKSDNSIINYSKKGNQIIITPHIAGMTCEGQAIAYNHAVQMLSDYLK